MSLEGDFQSHVQILVASCFPYLLLNYSYQPYLMNCRISYLDKTQHFVQKLSCCCGENIQVKFIATR